MFGPPDRKPPPMLSGADRCRGDGDARGYLEWTAAARWTAPWDRAILTRRETSGHNALGVLRAEHSNVAPD
jgi:hypothetical protein